MSLIARAWEATYRAQTAQVGMEYKATVGEVIGRAIISELSEDEIMAAGGTAEAGGYNLQMPLSLFSALPQKLVTGVSTNIPSSIPLVVLSSNVNNGIIYIVAGDPVANES